MRAQRFCALPAAHGRTDAVTARKEKQKRILQGAGPDAGGCGLNAGLPFSLGRRLPPAPPAAQSRRVPAPRQGRGLCTGAFKIENSRFQKFAWKRLFFIFSKCFPGK